MNSRQRLLTSLNHQEPDRVPFDLGSTQVTGIHRIAYQGLRRALHLPEGTLQLCDTIQGLALPGEDLIQRLGVDVRGLFPRNSHNWNVSEALQGDYFVYHDEWGITHRRPAPDGLYFSVWETPLGSDFSAQDIRRFAWPDFSDPLRIEGLRQQAQAYRDLGYAVVLKDPYAGVFEMSQRIVGMETILMAMASEPARAEALFDRLTELKLSFWEMALPRLGDLVDVVTGADDYGTQASQLISPRMYRKLLKPRWKLIFDRIHNLAPHVHVFFHSCGSVRPLIPDFIEIGVQILNPVHVRAAGMEPIALKRDFGADIVFWGGGVDTQDTLPHGTTRQVQDEVMRTIEVLAPGGGYVFNTVHNIQADVPPENILAMWQALQTYGVYTG